MGAPPIRRPAGLAALLALFCLAGASHSASPAVTLLRTPGGGLQPQAAVDAQGTLHLIYFRGSPAHGDIFYVHKALGPNAPFSTPIRVNSHPRSATAIGTIRGAQIAVGRRGRVFVEWNGSDQSTRGTGGLPLLFTRLNDAGTGFEPERDLITESQAGGLDGGGSLAADAQGHVYVTWHTTAEGRPNAQDAVYLTASANDGQTFGPDRRINPQPTGACGCCSMRAFADSRGVLYILYRSADQDIHRDTTLLISHDTGRTFRSSLLQPWQIDACPMSAFSLTEGPQGVLGAWETQDQVYFAPLPKPQDTPPTPAPGTGRRKYPVVAVNGEGQTLLAWSDGSGWQRGGSLAWQVFGADGDPTATRGTVPDGVPVWSLPTAVARPDGSFLLIH